LLEGPSEQGAFLRNRRIVIARSLKGDEAMTAAVISTEEHHALEAVLFMRAGSGRSRRRLRRF
jgi:hypothetical protein